MKILHVLGNAVARCPYEPSPATWWRWIDTGIQAARFTVAPPRRWSSSCGKLQRSVWSVFPLEQAALAMLPAERAEVSSLLAGLPTFSPVADKRGEAQAGAYDDG